MSRKGEKILSFTDAPGISPNIWFEDKCGNKNWIHVSVNGKSELPSYLNNTITKYFNGYVADVLILPMNNENEIYRSQSAEIIYNGLESIN